MYTKLNAMIVMHPMLNRNGGRLENTDCGTPQPY